MDWKRAESLLCWNQISDVLLICKSHTVTCCSRPNSKCQILNSANSCHFKTLNLWPFLWEARRLGCCEQSDTAEPHKAKMAFFSLSYTTTDTQCSIQPTASHIQSSILPCRRSAATAEYKVKHDGIHCDACGVTRLCLCLFIQIRQHSTANSAGVF